MLATLQVGQSTPAFWLGIMLILIFSLGILVWATSMFATYAVFGHHRPLNAVIVLGVVLLANMAFTYNDQLAYLVVFSRLFNRGRGPAPRGGIGRSDSR